MADRLKAVVFDYGQVLSFREKDEHLQKMAGMCGVDHGRFRSSYDDQIEAYHLGDFSGPEFWARVLAPLEVGATEELVSALISEDTASTLMLNPDMIEWAGVLRRSDYQTAILSNMSPDDFSRLRGQRIFGRLDGFTVKIFSCDVRLVKPDAEIYRRCLRRLRLLPESVLFIDDEEENIQAARDLGIHAYLFQDYETSIPDICVTYSLPSVLS